MNLRWWCMLLWAWQGVQAANILAVFPFPGRSQYIFAEQYLKTLASSGHQVTVINTFGSNETLSNFKVIGATKIHEILAAYGNADYSQTASQWTVASLTTDFINLLTSCILEDAAVAQLLRSQQTYDLVILETVQCEALFGLAQHFNALTIGISSYGTDRHIDELMGNISPLSCNPLLLSARSARMNFAQRVANVWEAAVGWLHRQWVHLPSQRRLYSQYFPAARRSFEQQLGSFSLMLLGQHHTLSYARAYLPNMIEVGGMHLRQSKPLPAQLAEFITQADAGVIYFSMGSNIKSADLPPATLQLLLQTFGQLQQRVLWKFEAEHLSNKPDNVLIDKWFPQTDILAHANVKLFITHGGLLSCIESIYYGKPLLGLPVFYDQHANVQRAQDAGYGLGLELWTLNGTQLQQTINELITNSSYRRAAELRSQLYRDQLETPLQRAIWWTEYVLRHKGAAHLAAPARDLNLVQLHSLDSWGLICGAASLIALIILISLIALLKSLSYLRTKTAAKAKTQ